MNHTATPWTHDRWVIEGSGKVIAECSIEPDDVFDEDLANADFIVRACNAHDELVAALQTCIAAIERTAHCTEADRQAAAEIARAALAKVQAPEQARAA